MKKIWLGAVLILLAGCDYEIPLSETASLNADPALEGSWTGVSGSKEISMEITRSGKNYIVRYTEDGHSLPFEGFGVQADGQDLIQLKLEAAEEQKYLFVTYEITSAGLSVYRLNPEVVSAKCQTAEEMLKDFAVHRKNPFLFQEPMEFIKSAQ